MREKLINKQIYKKVAGKCRLCKENIYAVLDVHRIQPGEDGGRYVASNTVVLCSNCHRKVHDKKVIIDRWYESTAGRLLRIIEGDTERFI